MGRLISSMMLGHAPAKSPALRSASRHGFSVAAAGAARYSLPLSLNVSTLPNLAAVSAKRRFTVPSSCGEAHSQTMARSPAPCSRAANTVLVPDWPMAEVRI